MTKTKKKIHLQPSHVQAYNFIEKYIKKNIVSPEGVEIAKGIKLTLRHTYRILDDLTELGFISKELYKNRSIEIKKPMN